MSFTDAVEAWALRHPALPDCRQINHDWEGDRATSSTCKRCGALRERSASGTTYTYPKGPS